MIAMKTNGNTGRQGIGDSVVLPKSDGMNIKEEFLWNNPAKADLSRAIKPQRLSGAGNVVETQEHLALEDQFRMISRIFENASEGIMILDASASIRYVNPTLCATTGYSVGELVGKTPTILKPGGQKEDFCAGVWKSLEETGVWRGKIWSRRKSGDIYPTWLSISSVIDSAGKVSQYIGISMDMSSLSENGELAGSSAMAGLMSF